MNGDAYIQKVFSQHQEEVAKPKPKRDYAEIDDDLLDDLLKFQTKTSKYPISLTSPFLCHREEREAQLLYRGQGQAREAEAQEEELWSLQGGKVRLAIRPTRQETEARASRRQRQTGRPIDDQVLILIIQPINALIKPAANINSSFTSQTFPLVVLSASDIAGSPSPCRSPASAPGT